MCFWLCYFFFSSRRRHTRCALVTGVQTCALPISRAQPKEKMDWAVREAVLKEDPIASQLNLRFAGSNRTRAIKIKLEIDTNPPEIGRASCRERVCQYV